MLLRNICGLLLEKCQQIMFWSRQKTSVLTSTDC
jgi:hypothetical protein